MKNIKIYEENNHLITEYKTETGEKITTPALRLIEKDTDFKNELDKQGVINLEEKEIETPTKGRKGFRELPIDKQKEIIKEKYNIKEKEKE